MASAAGSVAAASATTTASTRGGGAFYTLVPIQPRWRGERRSLRTLPGVSRRRVAVLLHRGASAPARRRVAARGFGVFEADDDATTDGDGDGEVGEVGANDDANDASSSSSSSIADAPSRAAASAAVRALADRVLPNGASVNDRDDETGETALVVASERGDVDDVRALLAMGAVRVVCFVFHPTPVSNVIASRGCCRSTDRVVSHPRAARRTSRSRHSPGGPRSTAPRKTAPSRALKRSSTPART